MIPYMQNYLHRRLLRLAGQPDTATDYYSDYVVRGTGVTCVVYESADGGCHVMTRSGSWHVGSFTDNFNPFPYRRGLNIPLA